MRDDDDHHLFAVNGIWHCWVYVGIRRVKRSTRCTSKRAARLVRNALEQAAANPHLAAAQTTTVEDALDAIQSLRREQAKAGERSVDTAEDYYPTKMGPLGRILGLQTPLASLSAMMLDGYVSQRRKEQIANSTIYKELSVLRGALKLAKRHGKWHGDIAIVPQVPGQSKPRTRILTPGQLDQLFSELERDDAARAAFSVATGAELRATVHALRADVGGRVVPLRGTKNAGRAREVPILSDWQRGLLVYALEHAKGVGGKLFARGADEWRGAIRYAARRAGIDHCTPNDLRRTYSSWLRAAGASNQNIAPTMGHADTRMLDRTYAQLTTPILARLLAAEMGLDAGWTDGAAVAATGETKETAPQSEKVPGTGIEPVTRGFSIPARIWRAPRENRALSAVEQRLLDTGWTGRAAGPRLIG